MRKLIKGIVEFRERELPNYAEHFRSLSHRQSPDALFISCSDSRVVPELVASTDPGDLFVMRNVGNMVPPADVEGDSTGDLSEASAIEYAVLVLNVSDIVICGHSECGAMKAAIGKGPDAATPNLVKWLHHSSSAVFRLGQEGPIDDRLPPHDQLSQLNVLTQLEHLATYPILQERLLNQTIQLWGWWFNIASGEMSCYMRATRKFEPINRENAKLLIERLGPG